MSETPKDFFAGLTLERLSQTYNQEMERYMSLPPDSDLTKDHVGTFVMDSYPDIYEFLRQLSVVKKAELGWSDEQTKDSIVNSVVGVGIILRLAEIESMPEL